MPREYFKILNDLWTYTDLYPTNPLVLAELSENPDPGFTTDEQLSVAFESAVSALEKLGVDFEAWERKRGS